MTAADFWAELGISRTSDAGAIRRAYAARIKAVRPDHDPQGFARLRDAYEHALSAAETTPEAAAAEARAVPSVFAPREAPAPLHAATAAAFPAAHAVAELMRGGDVVAAAQRLAAARAAGALSLEESIHLADQLGWSLATDHTLSADAVREAARRLGWETGDLGVPWAKKLHARLDGERWLETLRQQAASRWTFLGAAQSLAARIMLGRGKLRTTRSMGRDPTLRRRYGEFLIHAQVVGDQFDTARIEAVGKLLAGPSARPPSVFVLLLGAAIIAWTFGQVASTINPAWQEAAGGLTMLVLLVVLFARRIVRRLRS